MASERPIWRKPCSHANNFESLIAFRNTYIWGGSGDGGRRGWGRFQWFSGCNMLRVIFFSFYPSRLSYFSLSLSPSLSLSHHNQGKKKKKKTRVHARPNFFVFSLETPPPTPPPQMVILSEVLLQASVPGGGGGRCLAPNWVLMLEQKGRRKATKQCVTTLNIEWFFPSGPEKLALFY